MTPTIRRFIILRDIANGVLPTPVAGRTSYYVSSLLADGKIVRIAKDTYRVTATGAEFLAEAA